MSTITLRTSDDVANLVPRLLGFVPSDSLVIIGTGGAPTARVDLLTAGELTAGLAPALPHWQASPVLVAVYGTEDDTARIRRDVGRILPGVTVADIIGIGPGWDGYRPTGTELDARNVRADRGDLEADAEGVTDASLAVTMAVAAYLEGDGAAAWVFHDRARALGSEDERLAILARDLENATNPRASVLDDYWQAAAR